MQPKTMVEYLLSFPSAESSYPFGPDAEVFKVMGKMFALVAEHKGKMRVTLKGMPVDNSLLVSQFEGIIPGYHMNKQHWITVELAGDVPAPMLEDLASRSYKLVASKLTKAEKDRLRLQGAEC